MSVGMRVYARLPWPVQNLALSAYGRRVKRLRFGGVHREALARLRASQWASRNDLLAAQELTLTETLHAAVRDVPWYAEKGWRLPASLDLSHLGELPVLRKADLQRFPDAFLSTRFRRARLRAIHTGGTTGTPLRILTPLSTIQTNYAFFSRFLEWARIPSGARTATFAGRTVVPVPGSPPYWRRVGPLNTWLFSSYHIGRDTLASYARALEAVQPDLIDAYPSSIEPLARYLLDQGITGIRPRAVVTSSETLFPEVRQIIETAFDCPVFDHYGGGEMVALVTQCEHGKYHVNPEFGVLEVLDDGRPVPPGVTGEIVATGFINPAMPLLRYATGDLGSWARDQECACGRAFPVLERIEGRMDDVIVTPEGNRVGRIDPIFKAVAGIHEARVIQDREAHLVFEYVPSASFRAGDLDAILGELRTRVGPSMQIDAVPVQAIERTQRGKLRTVVNRLTGERA